MNNPLVSIIVPVYNVQNSVARCLESICAQTWKDIEVILVNAGSRDESFSICEQFREKDPRIVLVDKSNSGVSETRNCGMSLARGKYVQFVDSDDYLDPDFTERLVTAAEANNADLVIAPYWMVIPANSSKATQALENLQENLGIDAEKKPDDIREYGFLPEGIYDRDTFALRLMEKPASIQWYCSLSCTEKSTSAQYVITYSNVKVSSKTGTLTIQNRNDFEIVVHLLCEGEQEIVSGNISAGGCYSFANVTDKEYTVGIHADVDAATNIKVIVYDGKDTEPYTN